VVDLAILGNAKRPTFSDYSPANQTEQVEILREFNSKKQKVNKVKGSKLTFSHSQRTDAGKGLE
jgi:hypothetical protein